MFNKSSILAAAFDVAIFIDNTWYPFGQTFLILKSDLDDLRKRHDTYHNDMQHNDTQHNDKKKHQFTQKDIQYNDIPVYADCRNYECRSLVHYGECLHAKCCGTLY